MHTFLLLGTSGCHLCEEAELIVNECAQFNPVMKVDLIDIAEEEHWQALYVIRIPVLLHTESQKALFWPFTAVDVTEFISKL
ncbi:glutaredoxin family protein [Methylicorpusculum sp.]|uniref:glutaredoxin family protein n=1 Tax=Methylicorpusculum sp. TaxID=2713644 RepID=UPI002731E6E6|nr:glutaredoxin family protein [Methylicorpusculum sp.]MDP2179732.1 glutaredoxin family protein [Methylicorpusculum sp.]MDP3529852.1 glutaredoxin family protein [Methylicorpusculum sp.]MDZ4154036.1 glutaredoxin family protein [Methylicorpusculum sp.]